MYIIFDLDDTLIDTSETITPQALLFALKQLPIQLPAQELLCVNESANSSKAALETFLMRHGADEHIETAKNALDHFPLQQVEAVPGALELIDELKQQHTLAVVTAGRRIQQLAKLEKAGFSMKDFAYIGVTHMRGKKKIYQQLIKDWQCNPSKIFVVGDRIEADLQPAKELGMQAVHVRWGRGRKITGLKTDIDYTIDTLMQLKTIVYEHQN